MPTTNLTYQIALTCLNGVGDVLAKNLVAYCGSAELVFKATTAQLEKVPGIGSILAKTLVQSKAEALNRAQQELDFITKHHIKTLFFTDPDFPQRLKNCADSPILLYYKGSANLNADKIVAVVGTRTPSDYGKQMTEKLITDLVNSDVLVISGLAYGIDVTAHKSCVDNHIDTVGVLGHGLDRMYPATHSNLAKKMLEKGGLLTEFMSGTNPDRENFPKRNRIVAGMCDAVIVVESKKEGGSLITAVIANSYNKDVFAFPGKANDLLSEGCNALIKTNKAHLIESSADLFYIMNWNQEKNNTNSKNKHKAQRPLLINLSEDEQLLINAFENKKQLHIDEICLATQLSISKTSSYLLQLEFSNIIKSLPGKMYALNS